MYTVAMIGAGAISANHLAAVAQHPDTQLIAVADLDLERAQQAAAPFGAASYSDYREKMCIRDRVQPVRIAKLQQHAHDVTFEANARVARELQRKLAGKLREALFDRRKALLRSRIARLLHMLAERAQFVRRVRSIAQQMHTASATLIKSRQLHGGNQRHTARSVVLSRILHGEQRIVIRHCQMCEPGRSRKVRQPPHVQRSVRIRRVRVQIARHLFHSLSPAFPSCFNAILSCSARVCKAGQKMFDFYFRLVYTEYVIRRCSLVVEPQLPKLVVWVRFPSSAPV